MRTDHSLLGRNTLWLRPMHPSIFSILAGAGAPLRSFKAGEIILREGDPAEELYVVKSGKVEITPWETP